MKTASIGNEGRDKLVAGALYISDSVKRTLGPNGQNFAIEKGNRVTNDGITIARELIGTQKDELEERGAKMLVDEMSKVNDLLQDGSTTMATITGAAIKESVKQLPQNGLIIGKMTIAGLLKKLKEEKEVIIEKLDSASHKITSEDELVKVSIVSAEDETLGSLIGKAQWELGPDGVILAEESNQKFCSIEKTNGILIDNGFGTQMVINNQEKEALELFDVSVIYTNHTIQDISVLEALLAQLIQKGQRNIVIMARAFTDGAINQCMKQMEAGLGLFPLNAPYTDQSQIMEDLQSILGGRFLSTENSSLDAIQVSDVGFATHVLAKRMSTIFAGKADKEKIAARVAVLEQKREGTGSEFEKRNLTTRIAQLTNGFALLKIGATTEAERKYLKDKADDAVNATKLALQDGVVAGGGKALKDIADSLPDDFILKNAISAPYEQIKSTTGEEPSAWVQDSVKVLKVIVDRAASFAGILSTAAGAISTKKPSELSELLKK